MSHWKSPYWNMSQSCHHLYCIYVYTTNETNFEPMKRNGEQHVKGSLRKGKTVKQHMGKKFPEMEYFT